jgi:hypothetical protein
LIIDNGKWRIEVRSLKEKISAGNSKLVKD